MYTNEKNVQITIRLMKEHNIKHVVISPGGTNLPLVRGIQNDDFFVKYSVVDERSAAYFAIGLSLELEAPVALSCTAAQATRNYIPGLTEAFYKRVPILAITASKHPKHTYQEYMQAPDQTSMPADSVKKVFSLPIVDSKKDYDMAVRMTNDAMLELTRNGGGPVQLNTPIDDATVNDFGTKELPKVRVINRYCSADGVEDYIGKKKVLLVVGENAKLTKDDVSAINHFASKFNVTIYANHLSNFHGEYAINANLLLTVLGPDEFAKKGLSPDIVMTVGGQTGDYSIFGMLSNPKSGNYECWRIHEDGEVIDTYDRLTRVYQMRAGDFFSGLVGSENEHDYYQSFAKANKVVTVPEDLPFSNAYVAKELHSKIPANSRINFGILNSLRVWSYLDIDPSIFSTSNVSAFGIDGDLSLLIGQSMVTDELCFCILGDLAFFYDMNSLGIRHIKNNVRVLLINNGTGAEFRVNRAIAKFGDDLAEYTAATGHNGSSARGWAEGCNFKYLSASNGTELSEVSEEFISRDSEQPILLEVFTESDNEFDALEKIISANVSAVSFGKKLARNLTPAQREFIKKVLSNIKGK